jgi:hypothetical protein
MEVIDIPDPWLQKHTVKRRDPDAHLGAVEQEHDSHADHHTPHYDCVQCRMYSGKAA